MIQDLLAYNQKFVENEEYERFRASKYPEKKLAILSCMDTRLVELLPAALGIKNGDVKLIKNAGGVVTHPYGSVVRSLLVAIMELGVNEIMVIGHTDCGVQHLDSDQMLEDLQKRGISEETIELLKYSGVDFKTWLGGFDTIESSVENTVNLLKKHPLIPKDVSIRGFVMDSVTGALEEVKC